jgi:hypothetical protein
MVMSFPPHSLLCTFQCFETKTLFIIRVSIGKGNFADFVKKFQGYNLLLVQEPKTTVTVVSTVTVGATATVTVRPASFRV